MLRPIHRVACWNGLQAGFDLQVALARWLCAVTTTGALVNEGGVAGVRPHVDVQSWLWSFLRPRAGQLRLVDAAVVVADQSPVDKQALLAWIDVVRDVGAQFQPNPIRWPEPPRALTAWGAFKELMLAFYDRLKLGLPFDGNGNVVAENGITYSQFVAEYKAIHGERACVLCGGPLGKLEVDHWIHKAEFPILAIAPENLLPTCRGCNVAPAKGMKPTYRPSDPVAFADWFHPYLRPGHGRIAVSYDDAHTSVVPVAHDPADAGRSDSLDRLLDLRARWTAEFKARHGALRRSLSQLAHRGRLERTTVALRRELEHRLVALVAGEPNSEIERLLLDHSATPYVLSTLLEEI